MSYIQYAIDSVKLQTVDAEAWVTQIAVIAILLSAYWAPYWF